MIDIISLNKIKKIRVFKRSKNDLRFIGSIYFDNSEDFIEIESTTMLILGNGELKSLHDFLTDAYSHIPSQQDK